MEDITGSSLGFHQGKQSYYKHRKDLKLSVGQIYTVRHVITINVDLKKLRNVAQFSHASRKMDVYLNSRISEMHLQNIVISCLSWG